MKPKNRVFCQACKRSKILFESEQAANNYIKFNGEEILEETGKAPKRAYFCDVCGGWHVTSRKSFGNSTSSDVLLKQSPSNDHNGRLDAEVAAIMAVYMERNYEDAFRLTMRTLRNYKKLNMLLSDSFKATAFAQIRPILNSCLGQLYNRAVDALEKNRLTDSEKQANQLQQLVNELSNYIMYDSGLKRLQDSYSANIKMFKEDINTTRQTHIQQVRVKKVELELNNNTE